MTVETRFEQIDESIWVGQKPFRLLGVDIGNHTTVIRLKNGTVLVHSPTRMDTGIEKFLKSLGEDFVFIAPNKFHHLFLADYKTMFPMAKFYAAKGLQMKRNDFVFDGNLLDPQVQALWEQEVETIPFEGAPAVEETVFYHKASRTLIVTDLLMYFPKGSVSLPVSLLLRSLGIYGEAGIDLVVRVMIKDRKKTRESLKRMSSLSIQNVILSHREIIRENAQEKAQKAFAKL